MTTYRTGNHWGVTIVREPGPDATEPCDGTGQHPGHALCAQLVAVVVNGDQALAEQICALLNGGEDGERWTQPKFDAIKARAAWARAAEFRAHAERLKPRGDA